MSGWKLTPELVQSAVLGGGVLGGGGGGSLAQGISAAQRVLACGLPELHPVEDISPESLLVTCAEVGAPSAREAFVSDEDYLRPILLLQEVGAVEMGGLISCECGANASLLGWYPAVRLGIPVVDVPCDGRAHPTGVMGSMGLHTTPDFISIQAAAGGKPGTNRRLELYVKTNLESASSLVRKSSVEAGGMVAVARNPVSARYVKDHGAPGAIRQCIEIGQILQRMQARGGVACAEAVASFLGGEVVAQGAVRELELNSQGGYDFGRCMIGDIELTFWNEYMTLERKEKRLATFPDLMMTLDLSSGQPVTSAELRNEKEVVVFWAPAAKLILGAGVRDRALLAEAEKVVGKPFLRYLDPLILKS